MEQADKIGLAGLIIAGAGLGNIAFYFFYMNIPYLAPYASINIYTALVLGIIGTPIAITGAAKGSKLGTIGIILGCIAILLVILAFSL